jgi:hypothetical protein
LLAFRAERMTVEEAAQSLLEVRREPGCLSLLVFASSSASERELVARYTALATAAFGTP